MRRTTNVTSRGSRWTAGPSQCSLTNRYTNTSKVRGSGVCSLVFKEAAGSFLPGEAGAMLQRDHFCTRQFLISAT